MNYWRRWEGSTDPDDTSGIAHFDIEGIERAIKLPKFEDAKTIDDLLSEAFKRGAMATEDIVKSKIKLAMIEIGDCIRIQTNRTEHDV